MVDEENMDGVDASEEVDKEDEQIMRD